MVLNQSELKSYHICIFSLLFKMYGLKIEEINLKSRLFFFLCTCVKKIIWTMKFVDFNVQHQWWLYYLTIYREYHVVIQLLHLIFFLIIKVIYCFELINLCNLNMQLLLDCLINIVFSFLEIWIFVASKWDINNMFMIM